MQAPHNNMPIYELLRPFYLWRNYRLHRNNSLWNCRFHLHWYKLFHKPMRKWIPMLDWYRIWLILRSGECMLHLKQLTHWMVPCRFHLHWYKLFHKPMRKWIPLAAYQTPIRQAYHYGKAQNRDRDNHDLNYNLYYTVDVVNPKATIYENKQRSHDGQTAEPDTAAPV